jgi:DNA-directed RNA polymerase specialized sigma subunit
MTKMDANQIDGQGLAELKLMNDAIRQHQTQIVDLLKRRKQLILRLRKQRITYKELAKCMGVSAQLIYKIIRDDIDRTPQYDAEGKIIRYRGRPPKPAI